MQNKKEVDKFIKGFIYTFITECYKEKRKNISINLSTYKNKTKVTLGKTYEPLSSKLDYLIKEIHLKNLYIEYDTQRVDQPSFITYRNMQDTKKDILQNIKENFQNILSIKENITENKVKIELKFKPQKGK